MKQSLFKTHHPPGPKQKRRSGLRSLCLLAAVAVAQQAAAQTPVYHKFGVSTGNTVTTSAVPGSYFLPTGISLTASSSAYTNPVSIAPQGIPLYDFPPAAVAQSSAAVYGTTGGTDYTAAVNDLTDLSFTTGARTNGNAGNQWVSIDLGTAVTFSNVQLAAITAANLNGATLQVSTDNTNWTTAVSATTGTPLTSLTGATNSSLTNYQIIPVTARYVRVLKTTGVLDVSEFNITPTVSQSSGTVSGTYVNLTDNVVTAAATTLGTLADEWVQVDLGVNRSFSYVQLATAAAANLNGADLQVSTDAVSWTTLTTTNASTGVSGATIAGASTVYPITYTFAAQTARYVRLRKTTSVINVTEFRVGSAVAQASATSLAFNGVPSSLTDGTFTTGVTTTAATVTQSVTVNLGAQKTFSHVALATNGTASNLTGADIQTSTDGVSWTTQLSNITAAASTLADYTFPAAVTAQYVRVARSSGTTAIMISEFRISPGVTVSNTTTAPVLTNFANLYDNAIAAGITTTTAANQYVMLDLGTAQTFSAIQAIAGGGTVANLNGAGLQVSTDGISWTTLTITNNADGTSGTTFSTSSTTYPMTYTFAQQTARYLRVFRSASGTVSLGELRIAPAVFQSSATSLANNAVPSQFTDGSFTTGALTGSPAIQQYVALNFGAPKTFNNITVAPHTATANLDGATVETSTDGISWTAISSITNLSTGTTGSTIAGSVLSTLHTYTFNSVTAQYVRLSKPAGQVVGVSEFRAGAAVSQSSGTSLGTVANLNDNAVTAAAVTLGATGNQWVQVDLGTAQSFSFVQLATSTAAANLDGAELQVSTDGSSWTTVTTTNTATGVTGATLSGSSITYPIIYTFPVTTARYVRVFRTAAAAVAVSEFKVSPATYQTSGTVLATAANLNDFTYNAAAGTTNVTATIAAPQYIGINLGAAKTFSTVQLATTTAANLNGASVEVSTDMISWTTVVPSVTGITASVVSNFTFSAVTAQYVRVKATTGTLSVSELSVLSGSYVSGQLVAAATDNASSSVRNIGFSFDYDGTTYTQYSVNSNGLLKLGSAAVTSESINNTVSTTNTPKLFALWDDIATGTAASGGGVYYSLSGTAPNRVLTVDWHCNKANSTSGVADLNFQVLLYEGSNKIEYKYGSGVAPASASTGMTGTGTNSLRFISVAPNATPANTTVSYMYANDALVTWPGNGTVYSFTPTALTGIVAVPSDGNGATEDFASLDNAMGVVNWKGLPAGGYTINVQGGYTETAPTGINTTVKDAGLLLTATGTAASPIKIQWTGIGVKPVITAGLGMSNNDYIIGLAGSDYVTIDGLKLVENATNQTSYTNNKLTETGIALFKAKKGSGTSGSNGCQYNKIQNCDITLDRRINYSANVVSRSGTGAGIIFKTHGVSRGIALFDKDPLENTNMIMDYTNVSYTAIPNSAVGLVSAADVNSYNEFYSNTIDNAFYGIWSNDAYKGTTIAARGNIIGKAGAGNTITNFGAYTGVVPFPVNYSGATPGANSYANIPADNAIAIYLGGNRDAKIVSNTITTGTSANIGVVGIHFGANEFGSPLPEQLGKIEITGNTISALNANGSSPTTANSNATGILVNSINVIRTNITDSLLIRNNNLSNFNTTIGVNTGILVGAAAFYEGDLSNFNPANIGYSGLEATAQAAVITGNTITNLTEAGGATRASAARGIMVGSNFAQTYIENNTIDGVTMGNGTSLSFYIHRAIEFTTNHTTVTRTLASVSNNTIKNCNVILPASGTSNQTRTSLLRMGSGAANTYVQNNTIRDNTMALSYNPSVGLDNSTSMMGIIAQQSSGVNNIYVRNNQIRNNKVTNIVGGSTYYVRLAGISYENTTKAQNVYINNNTIDSLSVTRAATGSLSHYAVQVIGVAVAGSPTLTNANVDSNKISNLTTDAARSAYGIAAAGTNYVYRMFSIKGIELTALKQGFARKNVIRNNSTLTSVGYQTTATTASIYSDGNIGIALHGGNSASVYGASNNFIYDLAAPSMNAPAAITGIFIGNLGKMFVDHNTIVLGTPGTTPVTSTTTATFGVSGILYAPGTINSVRTATSDDQYTLRNNLIAIEATNQGTGASMCVRQVPATSANTLPGDLTTLTNGNLYYINNGTYNYNYGQGTIANLSGGIKNCFAFLGSATSPKTTYNLRALGDFNNACSEYEKFMRGAELSSYCDPNGTLTGSQAPPFAGGSTNPDKYFLSTGATSYAFLPSKTTGTVAVNDDYASTGRPALGATSGAYQTTGSYGTPKSTLLISYDPLPDNICTDNPSLVVNITKLIPTVSVSTANPPRVYYRKQTNTNQVPNGPAQNTSSFNGWKYVTPAGISGNQYTFNIDLSLIQGGVAAPQVIEYFVLAEDDASLGGVKYVSVAGASFTPCITDVNLYVSGGNSNTAHVPDTGTIDNYRLIGGSDLTKSTFVEVNNTTYTADNGTSINTCPGDSVRFRAMYRFTATGEVFNHDEFVFETATNTGFSTGLTSAAITDTNYSYLMPAYPSDVYARIRMTCSGTPVTATNIPYVRLTSLGCPTVTSVQGDITSCINEPISINITNTNTGTSAVRTYFLSDSKGKTYASTGTATSTSTTIGTTLTDANTAGTWLATVGLTKVTITNGGVLQAALAADTNNRASSLQEQEGMNFTTNGYVKLNSVVLYDDSSDGQNTTGFKLALYEANSHTKLYETGTLTITDKSTLTPSFTNWYVAPGSYNMVVESFDPATAMTGALYSPASAAVPVTVGSSVKLNGNITGNDINTLGTDYRYFLNWNITAFCTAPADSFNVTISPNALFSCAPMLWLKADAGITTAGSTVSQWNDQSGRAKHATQATTASQPLNDAVTANLVNFNPSVKFDGTADFMNGNTSAFSSGVAAKSYFIVADAASANTRPVLAHGATGAGVELRLSDTKIGAGVNSAANDAEATYTLANTAEAGAPKIGMWLLPDSGKLMSWTYGINGLAVTNPSVTTTLVNPTTATPYIGRGLVNTYFDNRIYEVLHYADTLDASDRSILQSYLAVKWGITLDQNNDNDGDGITGTSYVASNGQTVWLNDAVYNRDIFGIALDSTSTLHQRQSKSVNSTALITVGNNNIIGTSNASANGNNLASDMSYMIMGDDGGDITTWTATEVPDVDNDTRIAREWKVQETGNVGSVKIQVPDNTSSLTNKLPATATTVFMLVNSNGDFSTGANAVAMTLVGTNWEASYNFTNGQYFTFSTSAVDPCAAATPELLQQGLVQTVTDYCNDGTWIRYKNPDDLSSVLVQIDPNGNVFNPTYVTLDVTGILDAGSNTALSHVAKSATDSTKLAMRMISILAPGSYTVNGGVKLRIYYDPAEFGGNFPAIDTDSYTGWFKHPLHTKADVLGTLTPTALTGASFITPDTTGVENGVSFVEFRNITSFSTFGFMTTTNGNIIPLPVTLTDFTGRVENCTATLDWSTATERDNLKTEIQVSTDGQAYSKVAEAKSKNSATGAHYTYNRLPLADGNNYFRLKMIDRNGASSYSNVVILNGCNTVSQVMIYPNPVNNLLYVSGLKGDNHVQLLDVTGRVLQTVSTSDPACHMDMRAYADGIYLIRILKNGTVTTYQRIVKGSGN